MNSYLYSRPCHNVEGIIDKLIVRGMQSIKAELKIITTRQEFWNN